MKWRTFGLYVFLANILMYLSFLTVLTLYALRLPKPLANACTSCNLTFTEEAVAECEPLCRITCQHSADHHGCEDACTKDCHFLHQASIFIMTMAALQLMIKAFQLFSLRCDFFYHLSHWFEPLPAIGSIVFTSVSKTPCLCIPTWQWQIGVVTVFLGWITLLLYFRRLPVAGIYVVTFFGILINALKVMGLLVVLLTGFGLSLYMLFFDAQRVGRTPYPSPLRSVMTVLSHLQSEFGYDALFKQDGQEVGDLRYKYMAFTIWTLGLICIPILMSNLLIGVAVEDIKGKARIAALKKLALKVDWVLSVEELMPTKLRRRMVVGKRVVRPNQPHTFLGNLLRRDENLGPPPSPSVYQNVQEHNNHIADDVSEMKRTVNDLTEVLVRLAHRQGVMQSPKRDV